VLAYANYFERAGDCMTLLDAHNGKEYIVTRINTNDEVLDSFLFSLGCYSGEPITVVSRKRNNCTIAVKDGRYSIDNQLAAAIMI
jgi:ferrous iron transport protein A